MSTKTMCARAACTDERLDAVFHALVPLVKPARKARKKGHE
jgi:hypothetical protein